MKTKGILTGLLIFVFFILFTSAYMVDETEQVVITQFGKIIGEPKITPGLKFKIPFIQQALRYPKNLLQWDGDPGQVPTKEKTYIWVDAFARWKIVDVIKFLQTVGGIDVNDSIFKANIKLNDIIDPAVRNFITSNRLIETVRKTNRTLELKTDDERNDYIDTEYNITIGREQITTDILKQAQPKLDKFGIELVDVKIKRINYVDTVRKSVYNRMIAERKQIAEKFRSEGKGEAQKIRGEKERELKRITSEAYKEAQEIKGKADAEATKLFADAFNLDPEFYSFTKTLEIYSSALETNTSLFLSTDSEVFKYFKGYSELP
ncbi:protease modulator HflC [Desulfobacterales bacterium HSG17]|nr:protease modulator HflC [Desulfobacterales bacterium HSG17]